MKKITSTFVRGDGLARQPHLSPSEIPPEKYSGEIMNEGSKISDQMLTPIIEKGRVIFNRFKLLELLGEGAMGQVWLVQNLALDRRSALKLIKPEIAQHDLAWQRFQREAQLMAKLKHPNAVIVYDFKRSRSLGYIEMEYVPGRSLDKVVKDRHARSMPLEWTANILDQLSSVLEEAHNHIDEESGKHKPILHRDLKPSNLMLVDKKPPGQNLKVLDFGIAKMVEDGASPELTCPGDLIGTPAYMSPEQIRSGLETGAGAREPDCRSDLYSAGIILYQMLTGVLPFRGNGFDSLMAHLNNAPPPMKVANLKAEVPPAVERVVMQCLEKDPANRPQSARELSRAFRGAIAGDRNPGGWILRKCSASIPQSRRGLGLGVGALGIIAAIGLATHIFSRPDAPKGSKERRAEPEVSKPNPSPSLQPVSVVKAGITTRQDSKAKSRPAPGDLLETLLIDVCSLSAHDRQFARYVSLGHLGPPPATDDAAVEHERQDLVQALSQLSRKPGPVQLQDVGPNRKLVRIDIRTLGWDEHPFEVIREDSPAGPSTIDLFDLVLLEYPFVMSELELPILNRLIEEYLKPAGLVRPIPYVRADWLARAIRSAPLADDLLGRPLSQRVAGERKTLEKPALPSPEWGVVALPLDGLTYPNVRLDRSSIEIELKTNRPDSAFDPGDRMVIFVSNRSEEPAFVELVGTSAEGRKSILTPIPARIGPGSDFRFPQQGSIELQPLPGKESVTVTASASPFSPGILLRGRNVADRVIHPFERVERNGSPATPFAPPRIVKQTITIETRPARSL